MVGRSRDGQVEQTTMHEMRVAHPRIPTKNAPDEPTQIVVELALPSDLTQVSNQFDSCGDGIK